MSQNSNNNQLQHIYVQLLDSNAKIPTKGSALAAGYDLYAPEDSVIPARNRIIVKTNIAVKVPPGTYGRIAPRSGLSAKYSIDVGGGVIDQDYTGNVGVILCNHSNFNFPIKAGDRIAQLIIEKIVMDTQFVEVSTLEKTDRNNGGFGSTGV